MARKKYIKNTRLQTTLNSYATDLKELIEIKPKQFDIATIANMVMSIPNRKWNAAQSVVNATVYKRECENELKKLKAVKMLEASNGTIKAKLSNADDRKAYVDNDAFVQAAEIELINADAELTAAKLGYECLDDLFDAGRKIMTWLVEQDKATQDYVRYADEGRKSA